LNLVDPYQLLRATMGACTSTPNSPDDARMSDMTHKRPVFRDIPSNSSNRSSSTVSSITASNTSNGESLELCPSRYLNNAPEWLPPKHAHRDILDVLTQPQCSESLGQGVSASVRAAYYDNKLCAVKRISQSGEFSYLLFATESKVLSKIRHRNIIGFVASLMDAQNYYLILEKADYDLFSLMTQCAFTEARCRRIILGLLRGVAYLHSRGLAHRDLKPENVVFMASEPDCPRIIDFGDAEMARDDLSYTEFVGTPSYMAPERLTTHNGAQLKKSDVWAVGVMAFEMFAGRRCFDGASQREVFQGILSGKWAWDAQRTPSASMCDFVARCLCADSNDRLSASEALQHKWLN